MPKFFNSVPMGIQRSIRESQTSYLEAIREQKRIAGDTAYHVRPIKIEDIDFMPHLDYWDRIGLEEINGVIAWILNRIYQPEPRDNCVMMINGQTGKGKSYSAIELGLLTDPQFDINSICFSLREMRDRVEEGRKTIVLDDVETFAHSRDSMTKLGKWLAKYFDMVRSRRNFFIMTAPAFLEVEKILRERTIIQGICKGVNVQFKEVIMRTFFIEKDPNEGKIYKHLPIMYNYEKNRYVKINDVRVKKPEHEILKEYEDKKIEMFHKLGGRLNKIDPDREDEKDITDTAINQPEMKKRPDYKIHVDEMIDNGLTRQQVADKYNIELKKVDMSIVNAKRAQYRVRKLKTILS